MRITFICLTLVALASDALKAAPPALKVMTFNIRYGTAGDGEHSWPNRRQAVAETIRHFDPDVLGVQEALAFQLDYLGRELPGYQIVGVGRDDGRRKGEHSAILLRSSRLNVIDSGTRWLSSTPEQAGSTTWGGSLPRVYTWANVEDEQSGSRLHVVNTHWDHQSQESREKSAAAIADHLRGRAPAGAPAIVMGDLNAGPENEALKRLLAHDVGLRDTWRLANPNGPRPSTFNGFRGRADGPQIDWLLVSPGWRVVSARAVLDAIDGRIPSDHYPVVSTLRLAE